MRRQIGWTVVGAGVLSTLLNLLSHDPREAVTYAGLVPVLLGGLAVVLGVIVLPDVGDS